MGKFRIGKLVFDDDSDGSEVEYEKNRHDNENRHKQPFEINPEYDWERELKHQARVRILENEAEKNGLKSIKEVGLYMLNRLEEERLGEVMELHEAQKAWTKILTPKVGSGFSPKVRAKLTKLLSKELASRLMRIEPPSEATETDKIDPINPDSRMVEGYLKVRQESAETEKAQMPKICNKTVPTEYGHSPTKYGRSCYTCRYGKPTKNKNFVMCEMVSKEIWIKAQCRAWELKIIRDDTKWLTKHEGKFLDRKVSTQPGLRNKYYRSGAVGQGALDIRIGRTCFTCINLGRERSHERCRCKIRDDSKTPREAYMVWDHAVCDKFKSTKDSARLSRFMSSMRKSGADVSRNEWKRP